MLYRLVERSWRNWRNAGWIARPHPIYGPLPPRRKRGRVSLAELAAMFGVLAAG